MQPEPVLGAILHPCHWGAVLPQPRCLLGLEEPGWSSHRCVRLGSPSAPPAPWDPPLGLEEAKGKRTQTLVSLNSKSVDFKIGENYNSHLAHYQLCHVVTSPVTSQCITVSFNFSSCKTRRITALTSEGFVILNDMIWKELSLVPGRHVVSPQGPQRLLLVQFTVC